MGVKKLDADWLETTIRKAKEKVVAAYTKTPIVREWHGVSVDSYEDSHNRITMLVLEGSPPKGMIIINYGHGLVMAFDAWGKKLYTWHSHHPLP